MKVTVKQNKEVKSSELFLMHRAAAGHAGNANTVWARMSITQRLIAQSKDREMFAARAAKNLGR